MAQELKQSGYESDSPLHQYYMDIINCLPHIVYWVDKHSHLKGCNNSFVKLLGLKNPREFTGTPYDHLIKHVGCEVARIEKLRLDDLSVIFSGEPQYNCVEPPLKSHPDLTMHYLATRVPVFDKQKQIQHLVVILNEITSPDERGASIGIAERSPTYNRKRVMPKQLKILLVEDNLVVQKVEQVLFESLGCEVELAESGEAALKLFKPDKYQLVLMDIGLQDTSGYIVAKKIREIERGKKRGVPIIALTSFQAQVVKDDCSDYLMDAVITKPLSQLQAQQMIQRFVSQENIVVEGLVTFG